MKSRQLLLIVLIAAIQTACLQSDVPPQESPVTEWSGMHDAPGELTWSTVIASNEEPGDRLLVEGTVFRADGSTPAEGVRIYVYHTNVEGVYPVRGDETGNGTRHGYLRGWLETDSEGRYRFETIRPAPYQTHGGEPAHIHYTIQPPGEAEYWINAAWFSDDERVTPEQLSGLSRVGGPTNVMEVTQDEGGAWHGRRDLILE